MMNLNIRNLNFQTETLLEADNNQTDRGKMYIPIIEFRYFLPDINEKLL
jgi:hypothetical protein